MYAVFSCYIDIALTVIVSAIC